MKRLWPILIVLSMTLSSIAVVSGEDPGWRAGSSAARPDSLTEDRLGGYFTSNQGQLADGSVVLYSKDAFFTPSGVMFRLTDGETAQVYKMGFDNARQVVPRGMDRLPFYSNFFIGNDPALWRTAVPNYQSVVYEGLYPGIDLAFSAGSDGTKYEFIVHPGGNHADIGITFEGAHVTTDGMNLYIDTPLGKVVDGGLKVYQDGPSTIDAKMSIEHDIVNYKLLGPGYDRSKDLVIDPLIFSTLFGGGGDDHPYAIALDGSKNMYMTGTTLSTDFPTTVGAYAVTKRNSLDVFVLALNATGDDLIYATYYGGNSLDMSYSIAVDNNKNAYVCGETYSSDLPTTASAYDKTFNFNVKSFTFKLDPTGSSLVYATYVGGNIHDTAYGIVIDAFGNAYVTGYTWSTTFPTVSAYSTTNQGNGDIFVYELNAAGSALVYSTYIGGSGYDYGNSIDIDSSGNAYITGKTASNTDFPTTNGVYDTTFNGGQFDIYVLRLNSSGSDLDYSTFLGGSSSESDGKITVDGSGNAFVAGVTYSNNFPTTAGAYDTSWGGGDESYLFKLDPEGKNLLYSTYIGGSNDDIARMVTIDSSGNAYVTGYTDSVNFPTSPGAYCTTYAGGTGTDAFVFAVNSTGKGLLYSSYIGGTNADFGEGIAIDAEGQIYITGATSSADFPTTVGSYCTTKAAGQDGFTLKLKIPLPPGAVKDLLIGSGDGFVQLNWTRPDSDGGSAITQVRVFRGTAPGNLALLALVGNVTGHNDTTVTNGVTYYYAVSSKNIVGEGPMSSLVNSTPSKIPGVVQGITVAIGDSYANLSWSAPLDTGGAPILNYRVHKGPSAGSLSSFKLLGNVTYYNDTSAINGVITYFAVSASNLRGEGAISIPIKAIPGKAPLEPRNLTSVPGDGFVALNWDVPQNDGGYAINMFKIYRGPFGEPMAILDQINATMFNDTTVTNGVIYNYSISALNARGEGPRCSPIQARPGRIPGEVTVTAVAGNGFVNLTWEALDDGGFTISAFRVFRGPSSGALSFLGNSSSSHYNDTTVKNGRSYDYAVSAMNAIGEGPKSLVAPATPKGPPGVPLNLTAEAGNGYVALGWETPGDNGGEEIFVYRVYRGSVPDGSDMVRIFEVSTLGSNDTTVLNKAMYYYSVTAVNDLGEGPRSIIVPARPVGVPSKVQDLTAKAGDRYIHVRWAPPSDDGGLSIAGYRVFKEGVLLKEVQSTEINDTDVINGMNYTYDVASFSVAGTGLGSKVSAIPWTLPQAPTGLLVTKQGKDLVLTWSKPSDSGGFPVTGYRVFRGTDPNNLIELTSTPGTSYADTNIKAGNTYYYKVSATTAKGTGTVSDVASIKIKKTEQGTGMLIYMLVAAIVIVAVIAIVLVMLRKRSKAQPVPEVQPQAPPESTMPTPPPPSVGPQAQTTDYQQPPQTYVHGPVQAEQQPPGYPPQQQ